MGLSSPCHKCLSQGRKEGGQAEARVRRGVDETARVILQADNPCL